MDLGNSALSENLAEWAFYAAFPILRTARSSRLLTASRAAILNCHYRPKSARPLLTICGTGGRPAAVDAYFSWRERPQQVSKVNLESASSGIGSIWDRLHLESAPWWATYWCGPGSILLAKAPTSSATHSPARCSGTPPRGRSCGYRVIAAASTAAVSGRATSPWL